MVFLIQRREILRRRNDFLRRKIHRRMVRRCRMLHLWQGKCGNFACSIPEIHINARAVFIAHRGCHLGIALLSPHESAHFPVVRAKYAAQLFGKPVHRRFLRLCGVPLFIGLMQAVHQLYQPRFARAVCAANHIDSRRPLKIGLLKQHKIRQMKLADFHTHPFLSQSSFMSALRKKHSFSPILLQV